MRECSNSSAAAMSSEAPKDLDAQLSQLAFEKQLIQDKYDKLQTLHQQLLKKKHQHQFEKGDCFYIIHDSQILNKVRIGFSSDFNKRLPCHSSSFPNGAIVDYVMYCNESKFLESYIKQFFRNRRDPSKEWIQGLCNQSIDSLVVEIVAELEFITSRMKFGFHAVTPDDIGQINRQLATRTEYSLQLKPTNRSFLPFIHDTKEASKTKLCFCCQQEVSVFYFSKDSIRNDGLSIYCKSCSTEKRKQSANTTKTKSDIKKCGRCEEVLSVSDFYQKGDAFDGLQPFCKSCINKAKTEHRKQKKHKFQCSICNHVYNLRDSARRHIRALHKEITVDEINEHILQTNIDS